MSTRIESVATKHSTVSWGPFAHGALALSDRAARTCLERGGQHASDLDLHVNAGLYKEHSMAEPALASIIQEDIGANTGRLLHDEHRHERGEHGTFSFDVMNGGCGVLTALQLVDAFVSAGTAGLGLVVAGDADPSPSTSRGFPFGAVGGAILLGHHDDGDGSREGFTRFELRTFPEHAKLFEVRLEWDAEANRNIVVVDEAPSFASQAISCAAEVTKAFLAREKLTGEDIDLFLTSQYPLSFAKETARSIGIPLDRIPIVAPELTRAHTAGPIAALESAFESGLFARARRTLFVTAGAGITVGVALYEQDPPPDIDV